MKRAQGSMEYLLLIVGAVLFVVVVGVLLSNLFFPAEAQKDVEIEKTLCAINNTQLIRYTESFTGTSNFPGALAYHGREMAEITSADSLPPDSVSMCVIGEKPYTIYFNRGEMAYYLETDNDYRVYSLEDNDI